MASKEYRVVVHENGVMNWSHNGVSCSDPRREAKREEHLEQKAEETKTAPSSNLVGFEWCGTCRFYYRGPHEVGGEICNGNIAKYEKKPVPKEPVKPTQTITTPLVSDLYWEKCRQCDSTVCRKKHACKDGLYTVWCEQKDQAYPPSQYTLVPATYDKAVEIADSMSKGSEKWNYSVRKA